MQLRQQVLSGGAFLVMRQGIGLVLNLAGLALLTRIVGPRDYGLYVAAFATVSFLTVLSSFGIGSFLIRSEKTLPLETYQQASCVLFATAATLIGVTMLLSPFLADWLGDSDLLTPLRVLLPAILVTVLAVPPGSMLERRLDYRSIAMLELSGQAVYFAVAIPLAVFGWGAFALVAGYWVQQVLQLSICYLLARIPLKLVYSPALIREMVGYGFGFSVSQLIWNGRSLSIPLLVGRFAGVEAIAFVNLATRLVEAMTLSKRIFWRLSLAALAKIQGDRERLQRVLNEAMALQVLSTGPFLVVAGFCAPIVLPEVVGSEWNDALRLFPFVALASMVNGVFLMQSSVLNVTRHNWWVAFFHAIHVAMLGLGIALLAPPLGLIGYGWAEMIAIGSYLVLHARIARTYSISYRTAIPWLVAFTPPLFAVFVSGLWKLSLLIPGVLIVAMPAQRAQIRDYLGYFAALIPDGARQRFPGRSVRPSLES